MDYETLANEYVLHGVKREKSLIFERAEGSRMWDIHGKLYLDTGPDRAEQYFRTANP